MDSNQLTDELTLNTLAELLQNKQNAELFTKFIIDAKQNAENQHTINVTKPLCTICNLDNHTSFQCRKRCLNLSCKDSLPHHINIHKKDIQCNVCGVSGHLDKACNHRCSVTDCPLNQLRPIHAKYAHIGKNTKEKYICHSPICKDKPAHKICLHHPFD